jgi:hypothetical protein
MANLNKGKEKLLPLQIRVYTMSLLLIANISLYAHQGELGQ